MKIFRLTTVIVLLSVIALPGVAGGGWPADKNSAYLKFSQYILQSSRFYNPDGNIIDIPTISLYTTSFYVEYGITDRLTGIAYLPVFSRITQNEIRFRQSGNIIPGDEANSVGDFNIGVKYALTYQKKYAVAASLTLGLPLGTTSGGEGQILQTGDGEFNQLVKLEVSRSFYPTPVYATLLGGFNNRTNNFSDEVHFGGEVGYTGVKNLAVILKLYGVVSLKNGGAAVAGNGIFSNNTQFISYGPEVSYSFKENFGVSASAIAATAGRSILAAPAYEFGVFMKL